jgi:hypothetical protein
MRKKYRKLKFAAARPTAVQVIIHDSRAAVLSEGMAYCTNVQHITATTEVQSA